MRTALGAVFIVVSSFSAPLVGSPDENPAAADAKRLQGDWICVREEVGGKRISKDELKEMNKRLTVKGNKFTMKRVVRGKLGTYDGRFELNASPSPRHFDWTGKGPNGAAIDAEGIYKLAPGHFVLCYVIVAKDVERPTEFETSPKSGRVLVEFKREKDD